MRILTCMGALAVSTTLLCTAADTTKKTQPGDTKAAESDTRTEAAQPPSTEQGTACIIDSKGNVTRLNFDKPQGGFDHAGWLARVQAFEEKKANARAKNEQLRLDWIADEKARQREAAREASDANRAGQHGGNSQGWIIGGYGSGYPKQKGRGQNHRDTTKTSQSTITPAKSIFLPGPNITSPFPYSSTKDPNSTRKSFLP